MALEDKKVRILSIDGGGIRGIIPGMLLTGLEDKLKAASGKADARIADYFDLVAGTSTGGILGCALLFPESAQSKKPKYTAMEAVDLYLDRGDEIFNATTWQSIKTLGGITDEKYPADELEKALDDYLGGGVKLSELLKPTVITSYNIHGPEPFFFKQHKAKSDLGAEFFVKDVARATSAAPTYFECAYVKSFTNKSYPLIDGGVFVNNPSLCAYAEARTMTFDQLRPGHFEKGDNKPIGKDMFILSLGTASSSKSHSYKDAKDWGMAQWIQPLIGIMMAGVSENVDYQLKEIFNATQSANFYHRINPFLGDADSAMDNGSLENLAKLKEAGQENVERYDKELAQIAEILVNC